MKTVARDLYEDHFKAVENMPRGVVVTLRNIATQLESAWELHTNRQVLTQKHINSNLIYHNPITLCIPTGGGEGIALEHSHNSTRYYFTVKLLQ